MLERPKDNLYEILAELREEHRAVKAPAALESLLKAEAERKAGAAGNAGLNRAWAWGLSGALLALMLLGAVEWRMHRAPNTNQAQSPVAPHRDLAPTQAALPKNEGAKLPAPQHSARQTAFRHAQGPAADRQTASREESLADFIPLPASEGLPPASSLSLVRMHIDQRSLQQYGLEVPADTTSRTLLAEFVVGEDGLPRAIRIIP